MITVQINFLRILCRVSHQAQPTAHHRRWSRLAECLTSWFSICALPCEIGTGPKGTTRAPKRPTTSPGGWANFHISKEKEIITTYHWRKGAASMTTMAFLTRVLVLKIFNHIWKLYTRIEFRKWWGIFKLFEFPFQNYLSTSWLRVLKHLTSSLLQAL